MKSYLEYRRELKLKGAKPETVKREEKKAKGVFFANQIAKAPTHCENECGNTLAATKAINPASIVAHIIPKAKYPSVATHPLNRLYLCDSCHHAYDNGSSKEIQLMPCFLKAVERLKQFVNLITERRGLPKCFTGYVDKK